MLGDSDELLIPEEETGQIAIERFCIAQGERRTWGPEDKERLYFLLDARGSFAVGAVGARWNYDVRPDTVLWVPVRLEYTLENSGDARMRGVVFTVDLTEVEMERRKEAPGSPTIRDLHAMPQRNMVSFLTRTVLLGKEVAAKAIELSEYQTLLPGGSVPRHFHQSREEVCYVCRGLGRLLLENETKTVSAGEAVRIRAASWHSMRNESEDVLEYILVQASV